MTRQPIMGLHQSSITGGKKVMAFELETLKNQGYVTMSRYQLTQA